MIGAIIGDIVGSPYEGRRMKFSDYDFPLFNEKSTFTDDTILTIATAKAILENISYKDAYLELGRKYCDKGYGSAFQIWLNSKDPQPYNSWGNGSAMRVSPVGFLFNDPEKILIEAEKSASVTHDHIEGIMGAQSIALAIYHARNGVNKKEIQKIISEKFGYEFIKNVAFYKANWKFDTTCKRTIPQAMTAFFESDDYESCIRYSVLMGGDTDTIACIAGSLAEAYYKYIPEEISKEALSRVPDEFLSVIKNFHKIMKVNI